MILISNLLEIRNLSLVYGDNKVVDNISLEIERGEILCIAGESGSGKTSIINAILGNKEKSMQIKSGSILFKGKSIAGIDKKERRKLLGIDIGLVPQNPAASFNPIRTYEAQFEEAFKSHNIKFDRLKTVSCLESLGLEDGDRILKSRPYEMSGGMNQRVAIAMAMLLSPELLLCDEATSALDVTTGMTVLEELLKLRDKTGMAIFFITHNIGVAKKIADKIGIMSKGKLLEFGTKKSVLNNPEHEYTKTLLNDVPKLNFRGVFYKEADKENKLIEIRDLRKTYKGKSKKITALYNINLDIKEAEILGVVGESGSGKSTLLRQILCLENPTFGSISLNNSRIDKKRPKDICKYMQAVFQNPAASFDPLMTIEESLHETIHHFEDISDKNLSKEKIFVRLKRFFIKDRCCEYDRCKERQAGEIIKSLLKELDLEEGLIKRYPKELSGGQCQRMAIVRAISTKPKILICDEATSALDVSSQKQIIEVLKKLRENYGITIIFVSHDLALVSEFCDRILVLKSGSVVEEGKTDNLINKPQSEYTRRLINSVF